VFGQKVVDLSGALNRHAVTAFSNLDMFRTRLCPTQEYANLPLWVERTRD
jgi:hypothetical protein